MSTRILHAAGDVLILTQCNECQRMFNMYDKRDAEEFYYGHDCEA